MKDFFGKLFQKYIPIAVAAVGFFVIAYGVYFQTEGFTLPDVNVYLLLTSIFVGMIAGCAMARYLDGEFDNPNVGKRAAREGLRSMLIGSTSCFFLCVVVLYFCTSLLTFYIGIIGSLFGWSVNLWHFGVRTLLRKMAEAAKTKAEAEL